MKIVMLDALTLGRFDRNMFERFGEFKSYDVTKSSEVVERCVDADIIVTNKVQLDAPILQALPKLKLICITATGTNNIDLECAKVQGVAVKNVAGYSTFAVAQHTFMLALALLGNLPYYSKYVQDGKWCESDIFCHLSGDLCDLYAKKWGIIGLGTIGKRVCGIAQAFGAHVVYHSVSGVSRAECIAQESLHSLLESCDIVSIHSPLNSKTQNLIAKDSIKRLKNGAILLNLGRGGIVNEADVASALLEGQDFYFGADVLESEPMDKGNPLLDPKIQHKILITPHIAWAYNDTKDVLMKKVVENIDRFVKSI